MGDMPYQAVEIIESRLILTNARFEWEFAIFGRNTVKTQAELNIINWSAIGRILPAVADSDLQPI